MDYGALPCYAFITYSFCTQSRFISLRADLIENCFCLRDVRSVAIESSECFSDLSCRLEVIILFKFFRSAEELSKTISVHYSSEICESQRKWRNNISEVFCFHCYFYFIYLRIQIKSERDFVKENFVHAISHPYKMSRH